MDSNASSAPPAGYGTRDKDWGPRAWRIFRRSLWVLVPLFIYGGTYLTVAKRGYVWGGAFVVQYPGLIRFYALTSKASTSLGQSDEMDEPFTGHGGAVLRFEQSQCRISSGRMHHLWRVFYPAERIELLLRGDSPLRIAYSGPLLTSASTPAALPFLGPVYEDWFVRNDTLYRFVRGDYGARNSSNDRLTRSDVYLFEWRLGRPWNSTPRNADRVRLVESNSRITWLPHWMVDADHFITWDKLAGEVRLLAIPATGPVTVVAIARSLRPVRCDPDSPIPISRTGRYFAAEQNGLKIFRGDTLQVVSQIPESASTQRFFQPRPDELDSSNSRCYLLDDGITLLRVVTIYKASGDSFVNGTTVVLFNVSTGEVRDVPVRMGLRADFHGASLVGGRLLFYLTYTNGSNWMQCLYDPATQRAITLHPENRQPDSIVMGWDPDRNMMVDLPGFEANPQPLDLDSEICIEMVGTGDRLLATIRYSDTSGKPGLFRPGLISLSRF